MQLSPELIYPILTLILGVGIGYGWFRYATRDKSKDAMTEAATRREYDRPTRDDRDEKGRPV